MSITVEYVAQLKRVAGVARESIEIDQGLTLTKLIQILCKQHGEALSNILLDTNQEVAATLLLFLNDEQVSLTENPIISEADTLTISTPISGG